MAKHFNLGDLRPEPLSLTDEKTSKVWPVRSMDEFGALELAKFARLKKQFDSMGAKDADSVLSDEAAAAEMDKAVREIVGIAIPGFDRLGELTTGECYQIFAWWAAENEGRGFLGAGRGEAPPSPRPPARRSKARS